MAAARLYHPGHQRAVPRLTSMLAWSMLSLLPDADVIGFRFGIRYAADWGHRGATHSFAFALGVALLVGLAAPWLKRSFAQTFTFAALVVASHPVLDTLTDGGLGCALWWPFDTQRHFAPWHPIPVAPIGRRFFSGAGLSVAIVELALFCPAILFALWPRAKHER